MELVAARSETIGGCARSGLDALHVGHDYACTNDFYADVLLDLRAVSGSLLRCPGSPRRKAVPAISPENAIDDFAKEMLSRLDERKKTNLHHLRNDLTIERREPRLARFRRLEAQFGYDEADERPSRQPARMIWRGRRSDAAAGTALRGRALDAVVSEQEIAKTARRQGFRNAPKDGQRCSADRGRQARCTSTPGGWSTAWRKAILDRERRTAATFQKHRTSQRAFTATVRRRSAPSRGFAQPFRRRGRHQATFPKTERSANHFGVLRMAMRSQLVVLGRLDRENATALIRDEERDADLSARP